MIGVKSSAGSIVYIAWYALPTGMLGASVGVVNEIGCVLFGEHAGEEEVFAFIDYDAIDKVHRLKTVLAKFLCS